MDVRLPSGDVIKNVPDGTTAEQLLGKLQLANHPGSRSLLQALAQQQTAKDLESQPWIQKFAAGYGSAMPNLYRGAKQALGIGDQQKLQGEIDEAKRLDAPLMQTGGGITGSIAGTAAPMVASSFVPGANGYIGAAGLGALAGAAQPVASGEKGVYGLSPRATNMGAGAAAGMAGQFVGNMLGRAVTPSVSRLGPQEEALAQAAGREGIPLTAGQRTGSRPLQTVESVMENLPLTARPQGAIREGQQRAFTGAVLKRAGMNQDVADAASMLAQKQALGGTLGSIAERNTLDFSKGLGQRLEAIVADASEHLPPDKAAEVAGTVKKIMSGVPAGKPEQVVASRILSESGKPFTQTVPAVPPGPMQGALYQGWRQPLRDMADNTASGRYFGQIRRAMDEAFASQLQGSEAEAFKATSGKYANLKTVIDAMGGPGNLPAKGQVAPNQLAAALARSVGKENKALGGGDLNELSRIGQLFVRDQIPNSGTPQRALVQSLLTGTGGAGTGALYGGLTNPDDPMKGAMRGAGMGLALGAGMPLVAPRAIQAVMNTGPVQSYLANQMLSPAQRAALTAAMRATAIGSVPALEAPQ